METTVRIYDFLLVIALLGAAWKTLFSREAFTSTVLFVAFGLLMAIVWTRLGAIDVALAEACIGAGLTGALLIDAIKHFQKDQNLDSKESRLIYHLAGGSLCLGLFAILSTSLLHLKEPNRATYQLVNNHMEVSGSSHAVTSVLLNFRAFDTWLELGVLLLASFAAISIHKLYDNGLGPEPMRATPTAIKALTRAMLPFLVIIGGFLLWLGSHSPGGAFQAGSLIGAAGILLQITDPERRIAFSSVGFRVLLALGFISFLAVAFLTNLMQGNFLEYPQNLAGTFILVLELAATASIALTLNVMFACSHPWKKRVSQ